MGFPLLGWFFKRLGCGLLGVHFSLIYCQIQAIIFNIMFDHRFYILMLLFTTELSWWTIKLLLSIPLGVEITIYQLKDPPRRCIMKLKRSIARLQRRTLHCHIKFKKGNNHRRLQRLPRRKMNYFLFLCGW